ncbi:MAG: hypothetical protein ACLQPV_11855 [Vulcanimicrobiaceae bacterium]
MNIAPGTVLTGGEMASGTVLTSSNVAAVQVRVGNFGVSMQKTGVGRFEVSYRVPTLPFMLRGAYTLHVIASNSRGDTTERDLGITIQ